jgi:RNA polymerase sigma-70 factor (ECF subfamily)
LTQGTTTDRTGQFQSATLPHLDAAYNIARWLLRDEHAAQDAVQEAYLRAFRYFGSFSGGNARPWLLGIVRNTCYSWLRARGQLGEQLEFDEERDSGVEGAPVMAVMADPAELLMLKLQRARVDRAIDALPPVFREAIVLRELEQLSYDEIAQIVGVPAGTVMSRLARARALLRTALGSVDGEGSQ